MHKILVVNMNYMGDALLTTPALAALRQAHPHSSIDTVVGAGPAAQVLEGSPDLDTIVVRRDRGAWGRIVQLYRILKHGKYHEVVILPPLPAYGIAAYLAGTPVRVGLAGRGMDSFLTHKQTTTAVHMADRLLDTLRVSSETGPLEKSLKFEVGEDLSVRASEILAQNGISGDRPLVVFNVGATRKQKCWLPERVAEAIRGLEGTDCVLIGAGGDDLEFARAVSRASMESNPVSLVNRTSVHELAAILAKADVLVSADSGPMHLATAVGTPVVALFGSTDPLLTGPYDERSTVILHHLPCSPCNNHPTCGGRFDCMRQITSDEVVLAARSLLRTGKKVPAVRLTVLKQSDVSTTRSQPDASIHGDLSRDARPANGANGHSPAKSRVNVQRILIATKFRFIGDTLVAVPVFRTVRGIWPNARITLLTGKNARALLQNNPYLDEIIEFDPNGADRGAVPFSRLVGKLRREHYDLCLALNRSFHSALIPWLSGVRLRAGFDSEGRGLLLNRRVGYDRQKSEIDCYFDVLRAAEPSMEPDPRLELWVSPEERQTALELIHRDLPESRHVSRLIGFQPGASIDGKRWPVERFSELADAVAERFPLDAIVLVGGPDEVEIATSMMEHCNSKTRENIWSFVGACNLRISLGLLTHLDLFIGNDTAVLHAAVALGCPTVALFGPTNPRKWGHYGAKDRVVESSDGKMSAIPVSQVLDALSSLLESPRE